MTKDTTQARETQQAGSGEPISLDCLKSLNLDALRPVFDTPEKSSRQLSTDRRHVRRTAKAIVLDARRLANAIEHIGRLPEPGEAYHLITEKRYSMAHIIPATLTLAVPAVLDYLAIVTLSFSQANLTDLLSLLDAGQVRRVDFAYSVYFKSNEKENCRRLADELGARGHRVVAGLIHAKILLMQLTDGRGFVVESSANLRSCSSIEQITLTHDVDLLDFHRAWIGELFTRSKT
jgi:hypothetical protein